MIRLHRAAGGGVIVLAVAQWGSDETVVQTQGSGVDLCHRV
jgi:hypothetical protein